jgi:hypothetical protein
MDIREEFLGLIDVLEEGSVAREKHPLEGREVWVVSAAGLVEMKRRTGRKRDEADIEALEGGDVES